MPRRLFPTIHTLLSPPSLRRHIQAKYRLEPIASCELLHVGRNDTYRVHCTRKEFYLRVYGHAWRTRREIEGELDILARLSRRSRAACRAVARTDGAYVSTLNAPEGVRYAAMFVAAPGSAPDFRKPEVSRQLGSTLATLHATTDRWPRDPRRPQLDLNHLLDEPLRALAPYLSRRPDLYDYLQSAARLLKGCIDLPESSPEYGFCHGDCAGANVNMNDRGALTLFDFDCCGYGWRAYDAAVFLWWLLQQAGPDEARRHEAEVLWQGFLEGYGAVRPLSPAELRATRAFVAVRQIWLLGSQVGMATKFGSEYYTEAYFDRGAHFLRGALSQLTSLCDDRAAPLSRPARQGAAP